MGWLREEVTKDHFDYVREFHDALAAAVAARGYEGRWSEPLQQPEVRTMWLVMTTACARRTPRRPTPILNWMCRLRFHRLRCCGQLDSAPYRPTVVVTARLVSADGKRVLFEDYITYNNVSPTKASPITIEPDGHYRYPKFNALHDAGPEAIKGLQVAFRASAEELARQF